MKNRKAFTMVELVFVIVVVGILSAVALPKLAATRDDAEISKARATVAALRNVIATERQKNILKGDFTDINASVAKDLIAYGLSSQWSVSESANTFTYTSTIDNSTTCKFTLANNRLEKDTGNDSKCDDIGFEGL